MDHCSIERVVISDISLLYNNGKWIIMKKSLVIFTSLLLFSSSPAFSQPAADEFLKPLMDCLNEAVPVEKAKPNPTVEGIKDTCANELQLLSLLPPDAQAAIAADIDSGLVRHLAN